MAIILAIDPGSRKTGYGVIEHRGSKLQFLACGTIRVETLAFSERLKCIFESVQSLIERYQPTDFAIEQVFMGNNASSALKLGHARGAAITAAAMLGLEVHEYSARQIKQAVVGTGAGDKQQVQQMVQLLLKLAKKPQEDAADALACAICHGHSQQHLIKLAGVKSRRNRRYIG